jgi:hypothetical protein
MFKDKRGWREKESMEITGGQKKSPLKIEF